MIAFPLSFFFFYQTTYTIQILFTAKMNQGKWKISITRDIANEVRGILQQ